jgi:ribosomal-protein-alanine acetyltransferase
MHTHVAGGMTIGPASLDDLDAIEALEAAAFTGDRLSRRSLRAFIRAPRRPLLVARFGERIAGYALLSARHGGRTARIYSLAVDPAQTRRGVGRALLQACERYARGHGLDALRLEVRYDNPAAIGLYEKFGFHPSGRYPGYYEDGATALRFEKRLAPAADATAA